MLGRTAVAVLLAGCSYLQLDRPPRAVRPGDRVPGPQCTTERTWPVVDAAVGITGVVSGIGIAVGAFEPTSMNGDGTKTPLSSDEKALVASAAIVEGLLFAWSAYYGYQTTNECRAMHAWLAKEPITLPPAAP